MARIWERMGARVVYADDLAKELMVADPEVREKVSEAFGPESYLPDGTLNKAHLIREAFEKDRVDELNAIVHPAVYKATEALAAKAEREGAKLFVKEAALLLLQGRPKGLDVVVLVDADEEMRIKRVMERDGVGRKEVTERMRKQGDFSAYRKLADHVIDNNGDEKRLEKQAREVFGELVGL